MYFGYLENSVSLLSQHKFVCLCTITPLQYVHRMLCYSLDFHMCFALEHRVDSSSQLSHCELFFFLLLFFFFT